MLFNKHINKYYKKFFYLLIIGLAAVIAVDYFQLYVPEALGNIIDGISNEEFKQFSDISDIIFKVVGVGFILCAGRMIFRFTLFYVSKKVEEGLRYDMFLKAERLSQSYYHQTKVGSIMSWFTNDLETIEEYMGWGTVMLMDAIFLTIFCVIKMIQTDWILTIISAIPMALIIVWGALVEKWMGLKWEERQKTFDGVYDFSQETFTGIRVIKAFVKETYELHAFAKKAKANKDKNIEFARISVIFDVLISLIIVIITCLVLGIGGYFVYRIVTFGSFTLFNHEITLTIGQLMAFYGYFDTLIWPMIAIGQIVSMMARAKASLKRATDFLDQDEDVKNPENAYKLENVSGKITFNHFSFAYPDGNTHSLNDITLEINPGETIGIVGKIGSGKSTLVNSLLRLYNIEKGQIFIDGHDLMEVDIKSLRDAISYVPQDNFLFSDKIRNNIAFSNKELDFSKIKSAAKFADIDDNISGFKLGYDTISGERGVSLSGGQKQRISIARAYVKDAPIMIMDDSVSAVDVKTEENILKNIKENRKGKTTIVIASRVSTVKHMSRILVLNEGKVEAFDTPERLEETSETYKKMVYLQKLEAEVEGGAN